MGPGGARLGCVVVGWASAGLADLGGRLLSGVAYHCLCGLLFFRGWLGLPTGPCMVLEGWGKDQTPLGFQIVVQPC